MEEQLKKLLCEVFGESSEEVEVIVSAYDLIVSSAPTILSEAKTHLILLDHCRVKLSSIYYMISRKISKMRELSQNSYDSSYVQLVKRGRPSKDAIEAEIRSLNPEYSSVYQTIIKFEEIENLINMYIRCIDSSKTTTLEIIRNINRLD